ncbi:nuclear transcription factor Y subunit B-4-like [Olea europaea var. sylvestris]|uniref:nuclear transcription factor Y subunit B-4-like n=1 Tax=Olea europaea var. sylvestris TaxID=158386 RepID=UPI000C1D5585|nr:nuclear transcription factor Y subunit B-4-like [Olea europaea var. sylvestris]
MEDNSIWSISNSSNIRGLQKYGYTATSDNDSSGYHDHGPFIRDQDHLLPIANVGRIMKKILPPNAKISKEAKETMQECASEFICFVTGEASDRCHKEKRKTVNGDDVCWALGSLGFDYYAESLKSFLYGYREAAGEKVDNNQNIKAAVSYTPFSFNVN